MKKCYHISVLLVCVLSFSSLSAQHQNSNEDTYIINQYFQLNKDASIVLNNTTLNSSNTIQSQSSSVNLNQIGNYNDIDIKQKGENSQAVNQVGNNNHYQFINYYNSTPSNFNILQQGNSNSLQIYGENSIINNISIIQKSSFKTLIIKNY